MTPPELSGPARAPGMLDVARVAGVSHQTVSRVLNDHPSVRPETRARVLAAIQDLGYRRNPAARALATRRSSTIGLLSATSSHSGPVSTLVAVEEAARAAGLWVSVASLRSYDPGAVRAALDHFLDQGVDGIVVIAPVAEAVQAAATVATDVPLVVVAPLPVPCPGSDVGPAAVAVDQRAGARLVVGHLAGLGHTRIAHLGGPAGWLDAAEREGGWRDELAARGLAPAQLLTGDWSAASGYAAAPALDRATTAVFASNDQMALGLLRGLVERGSRVPQDVSVAGFDDIEVAGYALPPLTTVRQDFGELGRAAVVALLARLAGDAAGTPGRVAPVLRVRASTAPPPAPPDVDQHIV